MKTKTEYIDAVSRLYDLDQRLVPGYHFSVNIQPHEVTYPLLVHLFTSDCSIIVATFIGDVFKDYDIKATVDELQTYLEQNNLLKPENT